MDESIKQEVIGLLTQHRELTSGERAEIDTLGLALALRDNDPMWGSVIWTWAVVPRKEWIDIAHRALAAELRSDLKDILAASSQNSVGGFPTLSTGSSASSADMEKYFDEIKKLIEARPASAAQPGNQDAIIKMAVLSALESQKKGVVSVDDLLRVVKEVAREFVSWTYAGLLAVALGLCLFIGYQFGQHVQAGSDEVAMQRMEKQISDLTAALPKR